jgi:ribulose bisphosphate carboxylase small subunit
MPGYLVRLIDTRDMVGFFHAETMNDLLAEVDECTSAEACEYARFPAGGIVWDSKAIPQGIVVQEAGDRDRRSRLVAREART